MGISMHEWDASAELFAHSIIGYVMERMQVRKDTTSRALPRAELEAALDGLICPEGIGHYAAFAKFRDTLLPACRPLDDRMNLAYVPAAPSVAATMFDLVVSASSIFGGNWESGRGRSLRRIRRCVGSVTLRAIRPMLVGCLFRVGRQRTCRRL